MQFNTRTAMLRGLELRKRLGSWEAVEQRGQPVNDMIDTLRPDMGDDDRADKGASSAE